jgi:type II secretory pathway pseudopilin PulG
MAALRAEMAALRAEMAALRAEDAAPPLQRTAAQSPQGGSVRSQRGASLIDLILVCALIGVLSAVAVPSLHASRERDAVVMAARHLASKLTWLRIEALRRNRTVALRFDPDDLGLLAAFVDDDGDGVSEQDIDRSVDQRVEGDTHLSHFFGDVALRVATAMPSPDGASVIAAGSDPVRIGNTNLLSFSPVGTATSGTVYLAGRHGTQVCVRMYGATGRIRVLRFDRGSNTWRQD